MRKLSKAAKAEGYDALDRERCALQRYASHVVNRELPDAFEEITEDDGDGCVNRYVFQLYGCLRADGGIMVKVAHIAGQRSSVEVEYFDDWAANVAKLPYGIGMTTEIKIVSERLHDARRRVFARETERRA